MTPEDRQTAALTAIDRLIDTTTGWTLLRDDLARLEGVRRIITRHAPDRCETGQHWTCTGDEHVAWPCQDWQDATAGLTDPPQTTAHPGGTNQGDTE